MNVIEKILAAHCSNGSQGHVRPGMIVEIAPDLTMANDATAVLAIDVFKHKLQAENVHDPARVVFIMDHYTPSCSIDAAD
ncbi:MAG: 3-isopropylmalate dehydratase, large subunit, partial [uncultured bacterium]